MRPSESEQTPKLAILAGRTGAVRRWPAQVLSEAPTRMRTRCEHKRGHTGHVSSSDPFGLRRLRARDDRPVPALPRIVRRRSTQAAIGQQTCEMVWLNRGAPILADAEKPHE
jgi:hypothetical protein